MYDVRFHQSEVTGVVLALPALLERQVLRAMDEIFVPVAMFVRWPILGLTSRQQVQAFAVLCC